ncbi:Uncharacterised protein [Mycobacteroides abscessus subsp. abscessus]|nr:Uncharacterised protein [Mycobacteroides abscessus subsp. abscessus]
MHPHGVDLQRDKERDQGRGDQRHDGAHATLTPHLQAKHDQPGERAQQQPQPATARFIEQSRLSLQLLSHDRPRRTTPARQA